jgi:hypothetical protein
VSRRACTPCRSEFEAHCFEQLRAIKEDADVEAEEDKAFLRLQLQSLQEQLLAKKLGSVSGKLWEDVGKAWAECGQFLDAIKAYRCVIYMCV